MRHPGTISRLRKTTSYWIVPAILCGVCFVQLYLFRFHNLSPWMGGGFGMFSSLVTVTSRILEITLHSQGREIRVAPPVEAQKGINRVRAMPSHYSVRQLAQQLFNLRWSEADHLLLEKLESLENLALGHHQKRQLFDLLMSQDFKRVEATPGRSREILPVQGVTVKVWQAEFDREGSQINLRPLIEVHVPNE